MTTATPAPLTAFRTGRDSFLSTVMSGVSGLEEAVLAFEHEHQRRTAAAEATAEELGREVGRLSIELGEMAEKLDAASPGSTEEPAAPADDTELVEARETIRLLREELDSRGQDVLEADPDAEDVAAVDVEGLQRDLASALVKIDEQSRDHEEAKRVNAEELAAAKASWQADRASISGSNARLSEEILAARQNLESQLAAGRAAATAEAVRVLAAVAADSPDVPLSEAMDLVTIAMDVPEAGFAAVDEDIPAADEVAEEQTESPESGPVETDPEDADMPAPAPMLDADFFDGLQAPVVQGADAPAGPFAPAEERGDDFDPALFTPTFDLDAAQDELLQAEPVPAKETPKPGFSLFGRGSNAA